MEDKMIEIARFGPNNDAAILSSLLKSEGIDCFVRDSIGNYGVLDIKVDILKKDARRALEIMKNNNYEISKEYEAIILSDNQVQYNTGGDNTNTVDETEYNDTDKDETYDDETEEDIAMYKKDKARLSKYITVIIILMAIVFCLLVFLNNYFKGQ